MIRIDQADIPPIIRDHLEEIIALCRQHYVKRLDVFGSALSHTFNAESDVDFVVEFRPDAPEGGFNGPYFNLWFALKDLLEREVDLVEYCAVRNPYFREELDETRVALYET